MVLSGPEEMPDVITKKNPHLSVWIWWWTIQNPKGKKRF